MSTKLPNFLIVGAAKSGTSSLHNYLNQHPDIFLPSFDFKGKKVKEPRFLIKQIVEQRLHNGVWDYEEYKSLYSAVDNEIAIGEATVLYLYYYDNAIKNIIHYLNKDVKIIIMLRNPTERAYSAYQHVSKGIREQKSFEEALSIEENRMQDDKTITPMIMYKGMGMYYKMVKAYLDTFKNVHIILYDDFRDNTKIEMMKVYKFLGVENDINVNLNVKHNRGGRKWRNSFLKHLFIEDNFVRIFFKSILPKKIRRHIYRILSNFSKNNTKKINKETQMYLNNYFKDDIFELSKLINKDLEHWTR